MKINLLLRSPGEARQGYVNIDPAAPAGQANYIPGLPHDLSCAEANEVTELVAHDILDRYGITEVDKVLEHWIGKLSHGGLLHLSVVDLGEVSRAFLAGSLSLDETNTLLHGEQDGPMRHRQCSLTMAQLVGVLEHKGLKILRKHLVHFRATVSAQRP